MSKYILEVCVDSVESAISAYNGGATRIELCSNLVIGGTTPDLELFKTIRNHIQIPINVMIRPRYGDFCYTEYEHEIMCRQVENFKNEGADAVVIGSLNIDGTLNEKQMKEYQSKLVLAMAHDLRTPLTSLITFLEIAIKKSTNNENQEYIQKSYQKANQIRELTDQLFDFFLIQKQEKIELDPPANVEYALGEYLSEFCAFVEAEGYQVIVKNMEWGEAKVQVYHRYIGRIMDNLVSNIKKYADKEYPIILEMKNNENMIQIDFENQKNTKKEYVKGTGIGIQNIKNMMEQMKGESEIINNENRYAIVLSFPIYIE